MDDLTVEAGCFVLLAIVLTPFVMNGINKIIPGINVVELFFFAVALLGVAHFILAKIFGGKE